MSSETVLQVTGLKKYFPIRKGLFKRTVGWIRAVDDVSLSVMEGQTLGFGRRKRLRQDHNRALHPATLRTDRGLNSLPA